MPALLAKLRRRSAATSESSADVGNADGTEVATAEGTPAEKSTEVKPAGKTAAKSEGPRTRFGSWLGRPMTSFHLVISVAALLIILGLTMVLSASGVHSYDEDGSPWTIFAKQVLWTVIGLFAFYAALRVPITFMRRMALPAFVISLVLVALVLVPGIGHMSNGARGWFVIAGFSMQPSELTKIAFAIWGAHLLATRRMENASLVELLVPLVPAAVLALGLIVAEPDLGQTVSVCIILLGLLWYAGLPLKFFVFSLLAAIGAAAMLAVSAGYRSDRVRAWLSPDSDVLGTGYQSRQAKFALANGGMLGDGLGQGTAKFNYLPNAHNDFIFAIIGEELGFVGAVGMLALFGLFAYTGMRIARRSADPFLRLLTATTTLWVVGQVFINVGYVLGLLPVTGIQLPLISAGGTATATTLLLIGLIANAARHEPEAVAALRAGREDRVNRFLRLPLPEPYAPTRLDSARDRLRAKSDKAKSDKTKADKTKADKAKSDRVKSGKAKTEKARADKLRADKLRAEKARVEKAKSAKLKSDKGKPPKQASRPTAARAGQQRRRPTEPATTTKGARQPSTDRQSRTAQPARAAQADRGRGKSVPADTSQRRAGHHVARQGQQRGDRSTQGRKARSMEGQRFG